MLTASFELMVDFFSAFYRLALSNEAAWPVAFHPFRRDFRVYSCLSVPCVVCSSLCVLSAGGSHCGLPQYGTEV